MEPNPVETSKKDNHAIFAYSSLTLAILDIPMFFCGLFFAMAFGMGGMTSLFIVSMVFPILVCLGGLVLGIIGMRSKRKWAAIIGIVLPAIYLLLICGYFSFTMVLHPGSVIINPAQ